MHVLLAGGFPFLGSIPPVNLFFSIRFTNQKNHQIYFGVVSHAGGELCDEICLSWKQGMDIAMNFVSFGKYSGDDEPCDVRFVVLCLQ